MLTQTFPVETTLSINLLAPEREARLSATPGGIISEVLALPPKTTHVLIDEIQKVPALLDAVHLLIETHP